MALFNSFQFGDVDSKDYGVYISGDSVYDSPARSVDLVQVPGRNGALALDNGYYENIEVTYPAGSFGTSQEEWREKMLGIRNALAAQRGYQKLIDTYHPEHYRLGMFFAGISASPVQYNRAGQFPIRFNCKPQRFLISGDTPVEFTAEGQEEVYGPSNIVSFEAEEGAEIRELKVNLEPVQNLNGQSSPYPAGGSKNLFKATQYSGTYAGAVGADLKEGTGMPYSIMSDGRVQIDVTTAWRYRCFATDALAAGTYTVQSYADKSSIRATIYQTDGNLIVKAVKYNHQSAGLGTAQTFAVEEGDRIAICIGANAVATLITEFQAETGSVSTNPVPFENICPISGHTEVNVTRTGVNFASFNASGTSSGVTFTNTNGVITTSGTATNNALFNSNVFAVNEGDVLYLEGCPYGGSASSYRIDIRDGATSVVLASGLAFDIGSGYELTIPNGTTSVKLAIRIATGTNASGLVFKPVIYYKSTKSTYPISLGQTVYGGTLNVTTGVLTIDRAMVDLGTMSWSARATGSANRLYSSALPYNYIATLSDLHGWVSDIYVEGAPASATQLTNQIETTPTNTLHAFRKNGGVEDIIYLVVPVESEPSGTLVYEVAEPQTYQLTPTQVSTLLGQNNIWADAGEVEVKVASPVDLTNPTNFPAKPFIRVYGNGTVRVGDTIATVSNNADGYVDIDCESMNCYDTTGGRNADVSFSGNDFPELASGNNGILLTGPSKVEIIPRWWEL